MRIAINGIGIGGPTLAYWLRRLGHEPVLFERAPALRTGGYLVDFWGLGYEIAERMDLIPALRRQCYEMERMRTVGPDGRVRAQVDLRPLRRSLDGRFISVARSDLSAALFAACDGIPAHFGTSVTEVESRERGVTLTLSDGRREEFDVVVGADGLHSHVRGTVFGPQQRFERTLGCYVAGFRLRGYPHRDELTHVSYTVTKRQAGRVALRNDETLILLVCRSELIDGGPPGEHPRDALHRAFRDMGWEVPDILGGMDHVDDLYFDRVSQIHLPRWTAGRVALLGDAAACPSLLAGEGTGLAMTEAYVLAGELHRAAGDVATAFSTYERRLRAFVAGKQRTAPRLRGFFAPANGLSLAVRSLALRALSHPSLARRLLARSLRDDLDLPRYQAA